MFSCEYWEIFKSSYFYRTPLGDVSFYLHFTCNFSQNTFQFNFHFSLFNLSCFRLNYEFLFFLHLKRLQQQIWNLLENERLFVYSIFCCLTKIVHFRLAVLLYLISLQYLEAVAGTCSIIKCVLRNFAKFTGKHLCKSLFFNKVEGLRPFFLKKRGSGTGLFRWILRNF